MLESMRSDQKLMADMGKMPLKVRRNDSVFRRLGQFFHRLPRPLTKSKRATRAKKSRAFDRADTGVTDH